MPGKHWTREEDQILTEDVYDGASDSETSNTLSRSIRAVRSRRSRLGLGKRQGPQPDPHKRAVVIQMIKDGMSLNAIAKRLGKCSCTIYHMVQHLVKEGILSRTGKSTTNVKYKVTKGWMMCDNARTGFREPPAEIEVGERVQVDVEYGWRAPFQIKTVVGVITDIKDNPWGRDVTITLDEPTPVGNPEWPPVDRISISADNPTLQKVVP